MGNIPELRPGDALTFQSYDKPWANASNTPFRLFKHYVHEGGISTPLIAHWPKRIGVGTLAHEHCDVVDMLPTILAATESSYLSELGGHAIQPLQGESFLDLLEGREWTRSQPIFFEHEGNCAIRHDRFKLVRQHGQDWELYDMDEDRTELANLAGNSFARLQTVLLAQYEGWAEKTGVLDWNIALPRLLKSWKIASAEG